MSQYDEIKEYVSKMDNGIELKEPHYYIPDVKKTCEGLIYWIDSCKSKDFAKPYINTLTEIYNKIRI